LKEEIESTGVPGQKPPRQVSDWEESQVLAALAVSELSAALQ